MAVSANAQIGFSKALPLQAGDTVVNTATITRLLPTLTGGYSGLQIQVECLNISGTQAGTVSLYGSVDGSEYYQVDSTRNIMVWRTAPIFSIVGPPWNYYKVSETGVGTMTSQWVIWYRTPVHQTM